MNRALLCIAVAIIPTVLSGCWATSWTDPVGSFPASRLGASEDAAATTTILALPLWKEYRDTKCRTNFFFAPPILLNSDDLPQFGEKLRLYKNKATVYLFAHPTWRLSSDLLGAYFFYPDGRVVWASNSSREPWSQFEGAWLGPRWQQVIVKGIRSGHIALSETGTFQQLPERVRRSPVCGSSGSDLCCYADEIAFIFDDPAQAESAARFLETLPSDGGGLPTEVWNTLS